MSSRYPLATILAKKELDSRKRAVTNPMVMDNIRPQAVIRNVTANPNRRGPKVNSPSLN
jgi:hypothetical protein